ncbi:hypothetical protein MNBD_ALPHA06-2222 [hydrothermal vent metagenome]|uniref:General secretion pathway protein M n=1 Tax=hydrothermal vent metagenome TaxID=652676 RepID=A0A3B0RPL2_9ZZZZ
MSITPTLRLAASLLAVLAVLFSAWQVFTGVQRVSAAKMRIAQLSNRDQQQEQISPQKWLIHASSLGAAGAGLQSRLRSSARSADVSLTRVGIQPAQANQPTTIRATAQASGNVRAVAKFIFDLENTTPALIIERARINVEDNGDLSLDLLLLARAQIGENQ